MNPLVKALHRYQLEKRLSHAVIRELKSHGLRALYVGRQVHDSRFRFHPVSVMVERRILLLVRIAGRLTEADKAWRAANPGSIVLSGACDVLAALPAIRARCQLEPVHALARALAASQHIQLITD